VILSSGSASEDTSSSRRLNRGVIREIDDPHLGIRWLLMLDPKNAGGPGVLVPSGSNAAVLIDRSLVSTVPAALPQVKPIESVTSNSVLTGSFEQANKPKTPILRAGDRIVIEEHTPIADASLDAVALSSAVSGGAFTARLTAGGAIVRALALAPGRAVFAPGGQR